MNRASVASDILDAIRACLGEGCRYKIVRSRGRVPAENCDSLAAYWGDRDFEPFSDCEDLVPCTEGTDIDVLNILLTKICVGPDGDINFNWDLEDETAACFWNDLETIENCIRCGDFTDLESQGVTGVSYSGTEIDDEARGGAYDAVIKITITSKFCCPVVELVE